MIKMATWSVVLISRIFVQASAVELAHIAERSRKSQEIMPSTAENIEFSCKRVQSRTCSSYAERSRKSQKQIFVQARAEPN